MNDCKHFWRVFGSTRIGLAECERCHTTANIYVLLDAVLDAAQQDRPITITTTPNPPGDKNNGRQERNA